MLLILTGITFRVIVLVRYAEEEHEKEKKKRRDKYGGAGRDEVDIGLQDISTKVLKGKTEKKGKRKVKAKAFVNGKEL